jgi:hypothetical protein
VPLLGLAALLLAVLVLLGWILAELRDHAAGGRRLGRTVEQLLEPERVTLEEVPFPSKTCNLCGGPIAKRRESDRMWTRVWGSRVEHYHPSCWHPRPSAPPE